MGKKISAKEFIKKVTIIHNNKYDYSKVEYVNTRVKIIIICPKHGEFKQTPNNHYYGGCTKCTKKYRYSTEEYIIKVKKIHGDKFNYSKVKYKNTDSHIIIICPVHGEFKQTARNHLKGKGCPKCSGSYHYTTSEWITHAQQKLGTFYNYSKVKYIRNDVPVIIICPKHGKFKQIPMHHLAGQSCPGCSPRPRYTTKSWVKKVKETRNDNYDYSKVRYKGSRIKTTIICPKHGEFLQTPHQHLIGRGCPKCGNVYSWTTEEWIEKVKIVHNNLYSYPNTKYKNAYSKLLIVCPIHGEFKQSASSHLNGCGCPLCCKSKGEIKLNKLFNMSGVKIKQEYSYGDLIGKGNGLLRFDFAIFKNQDLIFLLEYQGELHFRPWKKENYDVKRFERRKLHDQLKLKYCESRNIPLEYINYDQDIETEFYNLLNKYEL